MDQASPTICVPAGMVIVSVTWYTPASKNMILQPAYWAKPWFRERTQFTYSTYPVKNRPDGSSVIRLAVALCSLTLDADNLVWGVVGILRVAFPENLPFAVEENRWFACRHNITLSPSILASGSVVDVTLNPRGDCGSATCKDDGSISDTNRSWNISQLDVVEYKRVW